MEYYRNNSRKIETGLSGIRFVTHIDNWIYWCFAIAVATKRSDCDLYMMPIIPFWFTKQNIYIVENINEGKHSCLQSYILLFTYPQCTQNVKLFPKTAKSAIEWIGAACNEQTFFFVKSLSPNIRILTT